MLLSDYKLLLNDWRASVIALFSLVWIANFYMSIFGFLRQDIKKEKFRISEIQKKINK